MKTGGGFSTTGPTGAMRKVKKYPEGSRVKVYYNPNKPQDATLEAGVSWGLMLFLMGLGGVTLVIGLGMLLSPPP